MKKLLLVTLILLVSAKLSYALSCQSPPTYVGIVDYINKDSSVNNVILKDQYFIDQWDIKMGDMYKIDGYKDVVQRYVSNGYQLEEKIDLEIYPRIKFISFKSEILNMLPLNEGDIIINGPPGHVCSYGFFGIFSREGKIQYMVVKGGYDDFIYKDVPIMVAPGEKISCQSSEGKPTELCIVKVNFTINDKRFSFSPGESRLINIGPIQSIFMLDSSMPKNSERHFWGMNRRVTYVIKLTD